jgi:hypothetical protein
MYEIKIRAVDELFKPGKSMFGVDPWFTTKDLRDEEEPNETS